MTHSVGWIISNSGAALFDRPSETAIVLLNVEREPVNETADTLSQMEGVTEVYSVAGRHDLAVIIRVMDNENLAEVVTNHMLKVRGITKSETLISFRAYSRHDLERMFSIGMAGA